MKPTDTVLDEETVADFDMKDLIKKCPNLVTFKIGKCKIENIDEINRLTKLQTIILPDQKITLSKFNIPGIVELSIGIVSEDIISLNVFKDSVYTLKKLTLTGNCQKSKIQSGDLKWLDEIRLENIGYFDCVPPTCLRSSIFINTVPPPVENPSAKE